MFKQQFAAVGKEQSLWNPAGMSKTPLGQGQGQILQQGFSKNEKLGNPIPINACPWAIVLMFPTESHMNQLGLSMPSPDKQA